MELLLMFVEHGSTKIGCQCRKYYAVKIKIDKNANPILKVETKKP